MKTKSYLPLFALFLVTSIVLLSSCESLGKTKDPNNLGFGAPVPFEVKFPISINVQQFNLSNASAPSLKMESENMMREAQGRILYSGTLTWNLDEICQNAGLGKKKVKKFDINKVSILPLNPKDYEVGFFRTMSIYTRNIYYTGDNYSVLLAESDNSTDAHQITFSLKRYDLFNLLEQGKMPIKIVTTQAKDIEGIETLVLEIKYKGYIKVLE